MFGYNVANHIAHGFGIVNADIKQFRKIVTVENDRRNSRSLYTADNIFFYGIVVYRVGHQYSRVEFFKISKFVDSVFAYIKEFAVYHSAESRKIRYVYIVSAGKLVYADNNIILVLFIETCNENGNFDYFS